MNLTLGVDQKLDTMLRDLAAKLGVTVQDLWAAGVKYTYATGVADLVVAGILLIIILSGVLSIFLLRHNSDSNEFKSFVGIICLFMLIPMSIYLYFGIREVLAPDGALLMHILQMITSSKK